MGFRAKWRKKMVQTTKSKWAQDILKRKQEKQQCKVGWEKEGSGSNQPELVVFYIALRDTLIEKPMLYMCDDKSLLKTVNRWIGEGGNATLVGWRWKGNVGGAPDMDILAAGYWHTTKENCNGNSNFLGECDSTSKRTSDWRNQHPYG